MSYSSKKTDRFSQTLSQILKRRAKSGNRSATKLRVESLEDRKLLSASGWAIALEGTDTAAPSAVAIDAANNVIVGSSYQGTVDFDPGPGVSNLTALGGSTGDAFVAKYTDSQQLVWARSFGGASNNERVTNIESDAAGNIYVAGQFASSTAQFGSITLTNVRDANNTPVWDAYVAKLDSAGNFLWAHNFGSIENDLGWDISVSDTGDVYLAGAFQGQIDFDPDAVGTAMETSNGDRDAFVVKLDAAGSFQWVRSFGGSGQDEAFRVSVDTNNELLLTGPFRETVNFGTVENPIYFTSANAEDPDTYVLKLDSSGQTQWAQHVSGIGNVGFSRLAANADGSFFTAGAFDSSVSFVSSGTSLTASSGKDAYIAKWTSGGSLQWAKQVSGSGDVLPQNLAVDAGGNVSLVGRFKGTVDANPGSSSAMLTAADTAFDGLLLTLDTNGDFASGYSASGMGLVRIEDVTVDIDGNTFVSGASAGNVSLPSGDTVNSTGRPLFFVNKLHAPNGSDPVEIFADSFEVAEWNGKWVEDSQNDWFRSTQRATDGVRSAEVDGKANNATLSLASPIDLTGYENAQLTFDWLIESGFDSGEYLSLDVSTNGGSSWQNDVRRLSGNVDAENVWHSEMVDLTAFASTNTVIRFRSKVSSSTEDANVDNVRITGVAVPLGNRSPVADAGADQTLSDDDNSGEELVSLVGTGSDSDGSIVSYQWSDGATALGSTAAITPTLTVGSHILTLTVIDDDGATAMDAVVVHVLANQDPSADAGSDNTVFDTDNSGSEFVTLVGSGSDSDGTIASYQWNEGTTILGNSATISPELSIGTHTLTLTVTDNGGAIASDSIIVTVAAAPSEVILFEDSFENGPSSNSNNWNGRWVEDSQNDYFRSTQRSTDGVRSAEVDGRASNATLTLATPINLSGFAAATLTFDWLIESGFDTGEYLALDVFNGSMWLNSVRQLNGNSSAENTWHSETVDLTSYASSNLQIRFRSQVSGRSEDANIDNVRLVAGNNASMQFEYAPAVDRYFSTLDDDDEERYLLNFL